MSMANNSIMKSTKEEEAMLAKLNEKLQKLEEEVDIIVTEVNDKRLTFPEKIQTNFTEYKTAKLKHLEDFMPQIDETNKRFAEVEREVTIIAQTNALETEEKEMQESLHKIQSLSKKNQRHQHLLFTGLMENSAVVLPEADRIIKGDWKLPY